MDRTVTVVYDEPLEICGKMWVVKELEKRNYNTKVIDATHKISNIEQRGKMGKLLSRLMTFGLAWKALRKSKQGEIVFCWNQWCALFFNMLPGTAGRYIISYNWLTPQPNKNTRFLYAKALKNPKFIAVVNSIETKNKILSGYGVEDIGNIVYIPDVFDDNEVFRDCSYVEDKRYCFIGGRANRDWELFIKIAKNCSDIRFVAVAARSDWKKEWKVPDNVELHFDTTADEYYELLGKAYLTIYPLKENKVSGLINIIKSVQLGKIVVTTKLEVTKMYYPDYCNEYLISIGDIQMWIHQIYKIYSYDKREYEEEFKRLNEHIKSQFSPMKAGEKLEEIITSFEISLG